MADDDQWGGQDAPILAEISDRVGVTAAAEHLWNSPVPHHDPELLADLVTLEDLPHIIGTAIGIQAASELEGAPAELWAGLVDRLDRLHRTLEGELPAEARGVAAHVVSAAADSIGRAIGVQLLAGLFVSCEASEISPLVGATSRLFASYPQAAVALAEWPPFWDTIPTARVSDALSSLPRVVTALFPEEACHRALHALRAGAGRALGQRLAWGHEIDSALILTVSDDLTLRDAVVDGITSAVMLAPSGVGPLSLLAVRRAQSGLQYLHDQLAHVGTDSTAALWSTVRAELSRQQGLPSAIAAVAGLEDTGGRQVS